MTFNGSPGNKSWEKFSLPGSDGEPEKDCSFFPKNAASKMVSWLAMANSAMVLSEMSLEYLVEGSPILSDDLLLVIEEMASVRCAQMKVLANSTHGNTQRKECLQSVKVPGYKWVPKE